MTEKTMVVRTVINAPAETVFDVLADPSTHVAIDGTGWVRQPVDGKRLTESGQIFRMGMYNDNHPNKHYEMANRVEVFDRPRAIAWQPGAEPRHIPGRQGSDDATIEYGGWVWRYGPRPGWCRPNRGHADLRLVASAASLHRHRVSAVQPAAPGQLAETSG
jgi:hypothetical protein